MAMRGLSITLSIGAMLAAPAGATSTFAHALVISGYAGHPGGGQFDCATSGPRPGAGSPFTGGAGVPDEGYGYCNLAGGIRDRTNANGSSAASESVTNTFDMGTHTQTADALADFGVLKASSHGTNNSHAIGGFAYAAGEASAASTDRLPTPAGARYLQFGVTIDGSASEAHGEVLTDLVYQIDGGPVYSLFSVHIYGDTVFVRSLSDDVSGFTVVGTSVSGSQTVLSFREELPAGSSFDLTLGLYTAAYPAPFGGAADNDFSETARLSLLRFYDAGGNLIDAGTITGDSGRLYDANGVHVAAAGGVPEPASWALLLTGFAALGGGLRLARARPRARPAV